MVYTAVYHTNHDPRTSRGTTRINTGVYNYPEHALVIPCYPARTDPKTQPERSATPGSITSVRGHYHELPLVRARRNSCRQCSVHKRPTGYFRNTCTSWDVFRRAGAAVLSRRPGLCSDPMGQCGSSTERSLLLSLRPTHPE